MRFPWQFRRDTLLCLAFLLLAGLAWGRSVSAQHLPSSAASISETQDPDLYLVANYVDVFLLDRRNGKIERITLRGGSRPNVPTGLAYDPRRERVFVANYRSNNMLVARLDVAGRALVVEQEFATDEAISPENVAIDPETGDVAIANYDGNDVQVWSQYEGGAWQKRCSAPVGLAHGVAYSDGAVWATSLEWRELLKLHPTDCSVLARTGRLGWGDGEFLWPTAIAPWGQGSVVVADAHTGRLQAFRTDSLGFQRGFGGNGPFLLNMPYSVLPTRSGGLLVLSTFGYEAVEFDAQGRVSRRYGNQDSSWSSVGSLNFGDWAGYRRTDRTRRFLGMCVHEAYARLSVCDSERTLRAPGPDQLHLTGGAYFYFVQVAEQPGGWVLSSPQNPLLLHFRKTDLRVTVLPVGVDAWQVDGLLTSSAGEVRLGEVDAAAAQQWPNEVPRAVTVQEAAESLSLQLNRVGQGWTSGLDTARHALRIPAASVAAEMTAALSDYAGFVTATADCARGECDAEKLCEISRNAIRTMLANNAEIRLATVTAASLINPCFGTELMHALAVPTPPWASIASTGREAASGVTGGQMDVRIQRSIAWILVGVAVLGAELLLPGAFLVWVGTAAVGTGLLLLVKPVGLAWAIAAYLGLLAFGVLTSIIQRRYRGDAVARRRRTEAMDAKASHADT